MAMEFRIFGEDYLKLRNYLIKNNFVHVKLFVKEGWVQKDTGKKAESGFFKRPDIKSRPINNG